MSLEVGQELPPVVSDWTVEMCSKWVEMNSEAVSIDLIHIRDIGLVTLTSPSLVAILSGKW